MTLQAKDRETTRPVNVDVWYPAASSAREVVLNYRTGSRGLAAPDAAPLEEQTALVLVSPGDSGSATAYSWLGEGLARQGFVVAGVSHGAEDSSWQRPGDCSAALDAVLADPRFEHVADAGRIGAIGHAEGGAAVIALAGATFDAEAMSRYCRSAEASGDRACAHWERSGGKPARGTSGSFRDDRVRAVVAMDPFFGPGHDAQSLSLIRVPVLIIGCVDNDFLPFAHHAGRYARLIPGASLTPLAHGEGHFVFVDDCFEERSVQGVPVCRDRNGVLRGTVHVKLLERVRRFFNEHLEPS